MLRNRYFVLSSLFCLFAASAPLRAQDALPVASDDRVKFTPLPVARAITGGIIGGIVGYYAGGAWIDRCPPNADECFADGFRALSGWTGMSIGIPVGVALGAPRTDRWAQGVAASIGIGLVGGIMYGKNENVSTRNAIPPVQMLVSLRIVFGK